MPQDDAAGEAVLMNTARRAVQGENGNQARTTAIPVLARGCAAQQAA
jgi:hypothetical protein